MKPATWQRSMLIGSVLALVVVLAAFAGGFMTGEIGATVAAARHGDHTQYRITAVTRPADFSAAVHTGDVFSLADTSIAERLRYANARSGDRFVLAFANGRRVIARIGSTPPTTIDYVYAILRVLMIVMAAFLAIRRPDALDARTLATFLLFLGFGIGQQPQPLFPDTVYLILFFLQQWFLIAALAQAVRLATIFPDPQAGGVRARLRRINPFVTAFFLVAATAALTMSLLGPVPLLVGAVSVYSVVYYVVATATAFTIANRRSTGAEKARVMWVAYSLAIGFSGVLVQIPFVLLGHLDWWVGLFGLTLLAIPAGLTYATLRHRVIDIGFVLNRAIAFTILSTCVVLAFGVIEWFLGKVVVERSHITSASIEVFLALVLGASLRSIHQRVERFADDLFFRERHRAEAALRRFALDLPYINDLRTIYDRTIEAVRNHAQARDVALYLSGAGGFTRVSGGPDFPEEADENDPLFVRMRATREAVNVHESGSAIDAEVAFPFIVRGRIAGALVCCAKTSGEAYAPDERAALAEVARSVGVAGDTLYTEALRTEIERVHGSLPTLTGARDLLRSATSGASAAS